MSKTIASEVIQIIHLENQSSFNSETVDEQLNSSANINSTMLISEHHLEHQNYDLKAGIIRSANPTEEFNLCAVMNLQNERRITKWNQNIQQDDKPIEGIIK